MSRFREGDIMKDFSGIEFASEHNGTDVFRLIELAYEQGQKDGHSEQLGTNLAEVGTDLISRQAAITALDKCHCGGKDENGSPWIYKENAVEAIEMVKPILSAQPTFDARDTQYNLPIGTDLISRQALLDKFEPWLKVKDYNDGELNMLKAILYEIRFMRSAQPETATITIGRTKGDVTMWYECDACGEPIDICDCYCRKCGRKLKHE